MNLMTHASVAIVLFFSIGCTSKLLPCGDGCGNQDVRIPTGADETLYTEPPPPIVTIGGNSFYLDANNSQINETLYEKNAEARKPVRDFLDHILKLTEAANNGDAKASLTIDRWLGTWADGHALTKVESQQAGFERKWILSGLLLAYLRNRPHNGWQNKLKIERWLLQLTQAMKTDYQEFKKSSQRNNHAYWAGTVALAMASINCDRSLMTWGLERVRFGLAQIDSNGFLPLELERKSRALQYHRVSLEALLLAAHLAKQQGVDLLKEKNAALERLAQKTLQGTLDPKIFDAVTGTLKNSSLKNQQPGLSFTVRFVREMLKPRRSWRSIPQCQAEHWVVTSLKQFQRLQT